MASFINRIVRAAKLDVSLYEEVEADRGAMGQAMLVVILSGIAAGIGTIYQGGFVVIFRGTIFALAGWYIWAFLTYFIGTKLLPEPQTRASHQELLRTIGFSSSPGIIRLLGVIPALGQIVGFVASVWMLMAMILAVKQALDYTSTWRAVAVCVIGWVIQMVLLTLLAAIFWGTAGQV